MAEESSSSKAAGEAPAQIVNNYYKVNAGVFYQGDHGTTDIDVSNTTIGGSHATEHREGSKTPKAIKRKNTTSQELQTPLKMTAKEASSQRAVSKTLKRKKIKIKSTVRLEDVFQDEISIAFADITSFKKFARSKNGLCLDERVIQSIVEDNGRNIEEQKIQILNKWRDIKRKKATVLEIRRLLRKHFKKDISSGYINLGKGIFGVYITRFLCKRSNVYLGEQISEISGTQTRAIKFVPKNETNLREAQILIQLGNHVNVVSIIHAGIHPGTPHDYIYIVMEHSWTRTVRNMIEECMKLRTPFNEFNAWRLVEQLMRAVEFFHSHNIIHRDLKPDNILASPDWRFFKVTDFELSKKISIGSATNQTNANTGTEGYRSRETYDPAAKITVKTDIFSAGATIGEIMANGKHPFGDDPDLLTYNIKQNKFKLNDLCVDNKDQVISLIKPMLEMDPEKRPTAKGVLNDVSHYFQTFTARQPVNAIIMFDESDDHMYSFNLSTKEWSRMQEYPEYDSDDLFTTVVSGKHIYFIQNQKVHLLEYSDSAAEWKEMSSMIKNHDEDPPAVVLNGFIYVCGNVGYGAGSSRSVERYDAARDRWEHMRDMNTARKYHCVVATEDHIYCIGGRDEEPVYLTQSVERFDGNKWEFVESAPRPIAYATAAVVKNRIYVTHAVAVHDYAKGILCYDIQNNSWIEIDLAIQWPFVEDEFVKILAVNNELYIIGIIGGTYGKDKSAIYLLEPEIKQLTLIEKFEDKDIYVEACLAVKL